MLDSGRWHKIEELFLDAAELAPGERSRFLDESCAGDPGLRAEVESLLANDAPADAQIARALSEEAARTLEGPVLTGDRLGAYRVLDEIGRGGMGAVYLATRDDDQYQKQVAIKVVRRGMDTADVLRRFRHERQILASLDHPFIARLMDGGSTPDGRPFLVMELVEGQAIDRYCRERSLGIEERLRLFLSVCEAVAYAHRKLVIHRDLKPANILISPAGTPKLLDFGLAKILDPETDARVTVAARGVPFTPAYASPEQIRGAALSTATDIFSLGVILYELLTGARPATVSDGDASANSAAARPSDSTPNALPTRWRKTLRGDLDTIVMTAMRPEPERRYGSVADLAADIRRYLEFQPILARPDSFRYRALKFARRRRLPLAASIAILASLIGGMLIAITQAHEAENARRLAEAREQESLKARQAAEVEHAVAEQERDAALAQRRISENRLTQIVGLSDHSVSEVSGLLERLPGAVPARKELIRTTLDYLEKLAPEAASNPGLQLALAKAYAGLGDLQFNPTMDIDGAAKSYQAGLVFVADALQQTPPDRERVALWLRLHNRIGEMIARHDRMVDAVAEYRRTLDATNGLPAPILADRDVARNRANSYLNLARTAWPNYYQSRDYAVSYVSAIEKLTQRFPGDPDFQYDLSMGETLVGWVYLHLDDPEAAAPYYERSIQIREKLVQEHPGDISFNGALMFAYVHYGSLQGSPLVANLGHGDIARKYYLKALPMEEENGSDPKNVSGVASYGAFLVKLGALDVPSEGIGESLATLRKATAILEPLAAATPTYRIDLAVGYLWTGNRLLATGNFSESMAAYRRSLAVSNAILAGDPSHADARTRWFEAERGLAQAMLAAGDRPGAEEQVRTMQRRAEDGMKREPDTPFWKSSLAESYLTSAVIERTSQQWDAASLAAKRALDLAQPLATGRAWDPYGRIAREARALLSNGDGAK